MNQTTDHTITAAVRHGLACLLCGPRMALAAASLATVLATSLLPSAASAASPSSLVVDANTGEVLHSEAADAPRYPASLTKMMTLYMVFDAIERRKLSYTTRIRISAHAASQPPSKLGLAEGDTITIADAVGALVTKSANDVAAAVAEHLAGSEWRFAQAMTQRARAIGMSATTFRNASGLPDPEQVTTARDMVRLGLRLQDDYPVHYRNFRIASFTYGGQTYRTHNSLLRSFHGTDGIKTGYTRASGFNLVSSVRRGRRHVVAAVFGGRTAAARDTKMQVLLSRGLERASSTRTRRPARGGDLVAGTDRDDGLRTVRAPEPRLAARTENPDHAAGMADDGVSLARVRAVRFRPDGSVGTARQGGPRSIDDLFAAAAAGATPAVRGSRTDIPRPVIVARGALYPDGRDTASQGGRERAAGDVEIQVGAYATQSLARQRVAEVSAMNAELLGRSEPRTIAVDAGRGTLYRARFAGFDEAGADRTCQMLRQRGVDCHVAR